MARHWFPLTDFEHFLFFSRSGRFFVYLGVWHLMNTTPKMPAVSEETFQTESKYNDDITKRVK